MIKVDVYAATTDFIVIHKNHKNTLPRTGHCRPTHFINYKSE